jgi:hypothetical protein
MPAGAGLLELIDSNQDQKEPVPFKTVERKLGGHQLQLLHNGQLISVHWSASTLPL